MVTNSKIWYTQRKVISEPSSPCIERIEKLSTLVSATILLTFPNAGDSHLKLDGLAYQLLSRPELFK